MRNNGKTFNLSNCVINTRDGKGKNFQPNLRVLDQSKYTNTQKDD